MTRLSTRVVWAVAAVLLLSQAASLFFYHVAGHDARLRQHAVDIGARVVAMASLLERLPGAQWPSVLETFAGTAMQAIVERIPPGQIPSSGHRAERLIADEVARRAPGRAGDNMAVFCRLAGHHHAAPIVGASTLDILDFLGLHDLAGADSVTIGIRIGGDRWLKVVAPMAGAYEVWSLRFMAALFVTSALTVLLAAWVTRRLTRPLVDIARAADGVGLDGGDPVPEDGPGEVRHLAQAFNRMQSRLAGMVEERLRLMAAIAHDYGTLITRLKLRAERMADDEDRQSVNRDLSLMQGMVDTTLAYLRGREGAEPAEAVDLATLVQSVCDEMADAGGAVAYRGPDRLPACCRPNSIERAVVNLIDNALKYGGGAEVSLAIAGNDAVLTVEDDGPGIPPEERDRVFEPFYRVEKARTLSPGGVGLGLSIVRNVVSAHDGEVRLEDRAPRGLRVVLTLPLSPRAR